MLQIPSYPSKYSTAPVAGAVAWISGETLDLTRGTGEFTLNVHPDVESANAGKTPIDQVTITLGQDGTRKFVELMADPEFASAFGVIAAKLYGEVVKHPLFSGAVPIA